MCSRPALARHAASADPIDTLATFGGFEIAMMAGAYLAAARSAHDDSRRRLHRDLGAAGRRMRSRADVLDYCVFAHASNEAGHRRMLDYFDAAPLLQLDLRLGEGTGAALALPLLRAAVAFVDEMASFESAGVSNKDA